MTSSMQVEVRDSARSLRGDSTVSSASDVSFSLPSLEDIRDIEVEDDENSQRPSRRPAFTSRRRYFACAVALWLTELVLVVALKRFGLIEPEFEPYQAMKQSVSGVFPQQLEQILLSRLNESTPLAYLKEEKKRPGFNLAQQGAKAHYSVVMVPGFVTSGLEVWGGKECARKHFRQRLWATLVGARSFLTDTGCWMEHMALDPITGDDPEGIRLRAASGFEAADYFLGNYWVWGKLIENLADVGYTPSNMVMMPYDWRLAFPLLEERDGYFTKLKSTIEDMHETTGKKVLLTSHSMGALVINYFFTWVTTNRKHGGGGGGKDWVDQHIHSYVNIAGSHLGVPKAATAMLSGEMSDTVIMGVMGTMVEQFFGRRLRRNLWSTFGSLWGMLPKSPFIWGVGADMCNSRSSDDPFCPESGPSPLLAMSTPQRGELGKSVSQTCSLPTLNDNYTCPTGSSSGSLLNNFFSKQKYYIQDIFEFLQSYGGGHGPHISGPRLLSLYGNEKGSSRTWHDPTRMPLPYAPNMRIYCLYGTGLDTERAYYYKHYRGDNNDGEQQQIGADLRSRNQTADLPVILDIGMNNETQKVKYGVRFTDGDGSVPLISLGYMCVDRWTKAESGLNPNPGTNVITREYKHQSEFVVDDPMRSGPRSADHVDILGNHHVTEDFLRVVTNFEPENVQKNHIVSEIETIAAKINSAHPEGGVRYKRRRMWWPGN